MRKFTANHLDDVLIASGASLIVAGVAILSMVAALIVAGAFLIVAGVLIGIGAGKQAGGKQ